MKAIAEKKFLRIMLMVEKIPVINVNKFLRNQINNMKSKSLAVTKY